MKHLRIYNSIRLINQKGSIRKAADALSVSPSALNRSIQTFEEAIGVAVFERVPTGVQLTSAGELLIDVVERHLVEFEELQRLLGKMRDGRSGRLRIGVGDDISAGLPLRAIADLEDEMPGVSADLMTGDVLQRLRGREIDLAVVTNPQTDRGSEVLASQKVQLTAYATPDWVASGDGAAFWDLVRGRLVLPPEGTGSRTAISHKFRRFALSEGTATSVAAPHLHQAMSQGARVCIFPRTVFDGSGAFTTLQPLSLDLGAVQVTILRRSGFPLTTSAQCFLRHLENRLNAEL